MKPKQDSYFWLSVKLRRYFSNIEDCVKSAIHKWIISHPQVIQYPIYNDIIRLNIDGKNGVTNT